MPFATAGSSPKDSQRPLAIRLNWKHATQTNRGYSLMTISRRSGTTFQPGTLFFADHQTLEDYLEVVEAGDFARTCADYNSDPEYPAKFVGSFNKFDNIRFVGLLNSCRKLIKAIPQHFREGMNLTPSIRSVNNYPTVNLDRLHHKVFETIVEIDRLDSLISGGTTAVMKVRKRWNRNTDTQPSALVTEEIRHQLWSMIEQLGKTRPANRKVQLTYDVAMAVLSRCPRGDNVLLDNTWLDYLPGKNLRQFPPPESA